MGYRDTDEHHSSSRYSSGRDPEEMHFSDRGYAQQPPYQDEQHTYRGEGGERSSQQHQQRGGYGMQRGGYDGYEEQQRTSQGFGGAREGMRQPDPAWQDRAGFQAAGGYRNDGRNLHLYQDQGQDRWGDGGRGGAFGFARGMRQGYGGAPGYEGGQGYGGYGGGSGAQGYGGQAGRQQHRDPDYHQWREEQLRMLDDDYDSWRKERYQKFSDEFNTWRSNRASRGGEASTGSAQKGGATATQAGTGAAGGASTTGSGGGKSGKDAG